MKDPEWLLTRAYKNKVKVQLGNPKIGRGRLRERSITSQSFSLQSLSHSSNGISQRWS